MNIVVFSGTSDGNEISLFLKKIGADVTVSTATQYGADILKDRDINIACGRLSVDEMSAFIKSCDYVIDATHPYAEEVTRNIQKACEGYKRYIRLIRPHDDYENAVYVNSISSAVKYLEDKQGDVFVSTGSKDLDLYIPIRDRVVSRVLDVDEVRKKCDGLGMKSVLYKRPPFSYEDNLEDFKNCEYLVTKDSGDVGGINEKIKAAEALNMRIIIIKRPKVGSQGLTLDEMKDYFKNKIG